MMRMIRWSDPEDAKVLVFDNFGQEGAEVNYEIEKEEGMEDEIDVVEFVVSLTKKITKTQKTRDKLKNKLKN